jgi:hypothetical protein
MAGIPRGELEIELQVKPTSHLVIKIVVGQKVTFLGYSLDIALTPDFKNYLIWIEFSGGEHV